jgi:hypothetical protein
MGGRDRARIRASRLPPGDSSYTRFCSPKLSNVINEVNYHTSRPVNGPAPGRPRRPFPMPPDGPDSPVHIDGLQAGAEQNVSGAT